MTACAACATELPDNAKFCHECGVPIAPQAPAEYKQVTVLFADVVRSMDLAAAVGAERLREIMTGLVDMATRVVRRYGGTIDKFTGDGIMAVFGAPTSLEDHAFRACLASLELQKETDLELRIGLNSGQVIAGEIGSGAVGYTAIGEQVGMAQRMESVAPVGGVMLSESTARLVESAVALAEPEHVRIKGAAAPVIARRLLAVGHQRPRRRIESALVGRNWELNTISSLLDEAVGGVGCVVTMAGPPGIGKSRLVREATAVATGRGIPVFTTYCESHASDIPLRAVAQLLRTTLGIDGLDAAAAAIQLQSQFHDADPHDLLLLEDLVGLRDATTVLPDVAAEARRRRLTTLINEASLARAEPAVYVIEDAHWIDEPSETMLADFLSVVPQTPSLTLITYRPEYRGVLARVAGAQNLALRPLSDAQSSALTTALLGDDPSMRELADLVSSRAAGNPFFSEEIVRDLTERGVVGGLPGAYTLQGDVADANVPATLAATIGARIDRLNTSAKTTLNAAAVIGARFDEDLLTQLIENPDLPVLIDAELVNQVAFSPRAEYAFRHPLIRTVAYESQLKADRAQRHRTLAAAIEARGSVDENAALIAEHFEAAGDLHKAYEWHMRSGMWSNYRDVIAARTSWRRAQHVADQMPEDEPNRMSMRIATRSQLAGTAWRTEGGLGDPGFDELSELCISAGDRESLAVGMAGQITQCIMTARRAEASQAGTELATLLESIENPSLTIGLSTAIMAAKHENGEIAEAKRLAQRAIDVAGGNDPDWHLVFEHPLAMAIAVRGVCKFSMGQAGWRDDLNEALSMTRSTVDPMTLATVTWWAYGNAICYGVLLPDAVTLRDTAETIAVAEQSGDDYVLQTGRLSRAIALLHCDDSLHDAGLTLLTKLHKGRKTKFTLTAFPIIDLHIAREMARNGDIDGAVDLARAIADELFDGGGCIWTGLAADVVVELLLQRGSSEDLAEAQAYIDRLASMPTDPGFVLYEITLLRLRTLLARTRGDSDTYRDLLVRYRERANELGFEGHMALAAEMV